VPAAGPAADSGDAQVTPAAAVGAPVSGESPDAVQWPRMDEYFDRAADGQRTPVVHPAGAAQALSIPQSQAERMFFYAETQGRLGPQQTDGSRRLLINDRTPAPIPGGNRA